jgi:hypothetical protein
LEDLPSGRTLERPWSAQLGGSARLAHGLRDARATTRCSPDSEEIDPTLARPIQSARQQALTGTQDVEKKLVQHLKKRQETELGQIARARGAVLPNGKPQERVLTAAPFLARYGPALVNDLVGAIESWYAGALEGASQPA